MPNVVIEDTRKTSTISLPSYPESKVEVSEKLSFGAIIELQRKRVQLNLKDDSIEWGILLLQYLIKDWNLVGKDGKKLPIALETFKLLDDTDGLFLIEKVGEIFQASRKAIDKKKLKSSKT